MPQDAEVLDQRCHAAYARLAPALLVATALSALLSAALWNSRPQELILFWQVLMLVVVLAAAGLAWAYSRDPEARRLPLPWVRRMAIAASALGAAWGFAAAVFFPGGEAQQV